MQRLPATMMENACWLGARNLCEAFNLLDFSLKCNNAFMHCETELFMFKNMISSP